MLDVDALPPGIDHGLRLVLAAALGAAVGLEREVHGHPAGLRTHLLVALGAALFTVISVAGFVSDDPVDPSRVAAQVVTGIGFLGAGAILKAGFTIRGLTTAASLWGTAAIGMAVGVGQHGLALVATAIILVSLWPLHPVADRLERGHRLRSTTIRVKLADLSVAAEVRARLAAQGLRLSGARTRHRPEGRHELSMVVHHRSDERLYRAIAEIGSLDGVTIVGTEQED